MSFKDYGDPSQFERVCKCGKKMVWNEVINQFVRTCKCNSKF